jgi:hypothetical protein
MWVLTPSPVFHFRGTENISQVKNDDSSFLTTGVKRRRSSVPKRVLFTSTPKYNAMKGHSLWNFSPNSPSNNQENESLFKTPPEFLGKQENFTHENGTSGVRQGPENLFSPHSAEMFGQQGSNPPQSPFFTPTNGSQSSVYATPKTHMSSFPLGNSFSSYGQNSSKKCYKPDHFDGNSDWSDYLKHFEAVSTWNGWNDMEKAMQLTMSLKGTARQTWSDSFPDQQPCMDFKVLTETLGARFKPEGREEAYKAEFKGRRKLRDETFMDFGYALRRLALRAFPRLDYKGREENIIDQFLSGLFDPNMKRHLMLSHPSTLEQAITMATEYDLVNRALAPKPPPKPQHVAAVQNSPVSQDVLIAFMERTEKALSKLSDKKEFKCFKCHKSGHFARDCPENQKKGTEKSGDKPQTVDTSSEKSN